MKNPIRTESLAKNVFLAAYFAIGGSCLAFAYFYMWQGGDAEPVAELGIASLLLLGYGAYLTIPGRSKVPTAPSSDPGSVRQESQVKNVFVALYWAAGGVSLTFARLGLMNTHLVSTRGPHIVRPAFVSNFDLQDLAMLSGAALVWLAFGTLILVPSRFPKPVVKPAVTE